LATALKLGSTFPPLLPAKRWGGAARFPVSSNLSLALQQGLPLVDALSSTGNYFPTALPQLVEVGEKNWQLPEVFAKPG